MSHVLKGLENSMEINLNMCLFADESLPMQLNR